MKLVRWVSMHSTVCHILASSSRFYWVDASMVWLLIAWLTGLHAIVTQRPLVCINWPPRMKAPDNHLVIYFNKHTWRYIEYKQRTHWIWKFIDTKRETNASNCFCIQRSISLMLSFARFRRSKCELDASARRHEGPVFGRKSCNVWNISPYQGLWTRGDVLPPNKHTANRK